MELKRRLRREKIRLSQINVVLSTKFKTWGELIEREQTDRILGAASSILGSKGRGLQTTIEDYINR